MQALMNKKDKISKTSWMLCFLYKDRHETALVLEGVNGEGNRVIEGVYLGRDATVKHLSFNKLEEVKALAKNKKVFTTDLGLEQVKAFKMLFNQVRKVKMTYLEKEEKPGKFVSTDKVSKSVSEIFSGKAYDAYSWALMVWQTLKLDFNEKNLSVCVVNENPDKPVMANNPSELEEPIEKPLVQRMIEMQKGLLPQAKALTLTVQLPIDKLVEVKCTSEEEAKVHLFQAIQQGKVEPLRWLFTYQPKWVHLKTNSGMTLIHLAAQNNQGPVVEVLLQFGATLTSQNEKGAGLLHSAIEHPLLVKQFIERAPTLIEMRDHEGNTPLHYAASGYLETVKILIQHKALIESKNHLGETPLHVAASLGQTQIVSYLLEHGANYQATDKEGRLPETLAEQQKHFEVAHLFSKHRNTFANKITFLKGHDSVIGSLSKTQYYLLDTIYPSEGEALYQQTGIQIDFLGQKEHIWKKSKGNFGEVGIARNGGTGQFVAVKTITEKDKIEASINEGKLQKLLEGQPHLMPLFDYLYLPEQQKIYQFMLFAELGDGQKLKRQLSLLSQAEWLWSNPLIKLKVLIHVAKSLLTACHYMHQNDLIHNDIKPDNLLIDRYGRVYLSDFGCTFQTKGKTLNNEGDIRYFSPEKLLARKNQSTTPFEAKLADAWAVGITLAEIASFISPQTEFDGHLTQEQLLNRVNHLACLNLPGLFQVIKGLLAENPEKRLSAPAALAQEVFQNPTFQFTEQEQTETFQLLYSSPSNTQVNLNQNFSFFASKPSSHIYKPAELDVSKIYQGDPSQNSMTMESASAKNL